MRRFDSGYAAANARVDEGAIGTPVVFTSTSRDPFRTSLEYANPACSGGIPIDMGLHDFDPARWFMGEVAAVHGAGARWRTPSCARSATWTTRLSRWCSPTVDWAWSM